MNPDEINSLLCQLLQVPLPAASLAEALASCSPDDWAALLAAAHRHKVQPMLYQKLGALPAVGVPQDVQEQVRRAYLKTLVLNRKLLSDLRQILLAFTDQGLDVIVLKGAYLLEHAYAQLGLRGMYDIDLLVRQADLPAAIACLQGLGYQKEKHFDPEEDNWDIKHIPPMVNHNGLYVEVHWSLLTGNDPVQPDLAGIWRRAVPARIAGEDALAMSAEDLFLHLCTHATYQHSLLFGLRSLVDIQQFLFSHQDRIDWGQLVRIAKAWGVERVVGLTFHLLDHVLAYPPPPGLLGALLPEPIDPAVIDRTLEVLYHQPERSSALRSVEISRLYASQGIKSRIELIIGRIFLPKKEMARIYGLPPHDWRVVAYYPYRVVQLITRHALSYIGLYKGGQTGFENRQAAQAMLDDKDTKTAIKNWMAKQ